MNKTAFLAAVKCAAKGWYQAHDKSPLDEAAEFAVKQSLEVKQIAWRLYPEGKPALGGPGHDRYVDTRLYMRDNAAVLAAVFRAGPLLASVDILKRHGSGWSVIEIKSSFSDSAKLDDYVDALAYTTMVLRRAGVEVTSSALLMLSRDYRRGDPVDKLFTLLDKTGDVADSAQQYDARADAAAAAVGADEPPSAALIRACWSCDFFATLCLGAGRGHTVIELPRLHHTKAAKLCEQGVIDIADVPDDLKLNDTQKRARASMESGEPVVDADGLRLALAAVMWPCHYFDFETVSTTLPLYDGYGCHAPILTQFSIHHRDALDAEPTHSEFLAESHEAQERPLVERLIEALGSRGAIIVYSGFEKVRIKGLIDRFPDLEQPLTAISVRIVDFEKIIRGNVYHPSFAGSFSLKKVVPALVRDVSYEGLAVANGSAAITLFARMARGEVQDVASARRDLLVYCETDTLVMVRLHEILASMARMPPKPCRQTQIVSAIE